MNWIERLEKICEKVFPMPCKPCNADREEIKHARFMRRIRWQKILHSMSEEEKERQVREWEMKYEVNGVNHST